LGGSTTGKGKRNRPMEPFLSLKKSAPQRCRREGGTLRRKRKVWAREMVKAAFENAGKIEKWEIKKASQPDIKQGTSRRRTGEKETQDALKLSGH